MGFASFLAPTIFVELPIALLELWRPPSSEAWHPVAQATWYGLTLLRVVCPVLMLRALPYMFVEEARAIYFS